MSDSPSQNARDSIQARDRNNVGEQIAENVKKRALRKGKEQQQELDAVVRRLLDEAEKALVGDSPHDIRDILETAHYFLIADNDRLFEVLHPHDDRLSAYEKSQVVSIRTSREQGLHPPPKAELEVLHKLAQALEITTAVGDKSRYAEVTFGEIDAPGRTSREEPVPIGRLRVGAGSSASLDDRAPTIDHADCEHLLTIALPRQGKDSTIARICGNLKDQHAYKWFSLFDDGRNETPMVAIPSDDDGIRANLERFEQTPKGYETAVFVPATSGLPEELPANFNAFTIGLDDLTPKMVLRLAGVTTEDPNTVRRVGQALRVAREESEGVESLIRRLQEFADETEATITVTELEDDELAERDDGTEYVYDADAVEQTEGEIREMRYKMPADSVLEECAQALMLLSGEGLIADSGVETNIDMEAEFRRDRVAVLNCNFLEERNKPLKYVILNLWLRLIYRARDANPRLPRAVLELRELKNLAPSVLENSEYPSVVKPLRNTLYFLATQGGSRRIMLAGSTQKLNHVYKAVRTNMPNKILLKLGQEEILTLNKAYNFSDEQKRQLSQFSVGTGMLIEGGSAHWPIEWCGARCGLGLGDEHWRDRYAKAWGARVREYHGDRWSDQHGEGDHWVDLEGNIHTGAETPELGDWYLFLDDILETAPVAIGAERAGVQGEISVQVVETALEGRREYEIPSDLTLETTVAANQRRELTMRSSEQAEEMRQDRLLEEHDVPDALYPWVDMKETKIENMARVLRTVSSERLESHGDIAQAVGLSESVVSDYLASPDHLRRCVEKNGTGYKLTPLGERAKAVDWRPLVA